MELNFAGNKFSSNSRKSAKFNPEKNLLLTLEISRNLIPLKYDKTATKEIYESLAQGWTPFLFLPGERRISPVVFPNFLGIRRRLI